MTQEEVADLMDTHKPVISRLEAGNPNIKHFTSLLTIAKFVSAVGYELKLTLIPLKNLPKKKSVKHRRITK